MEGMGRLQFSDLFSQNCQFHHRRLESLEHLMCLMGDPIREIKRKSFTSAVLFTTDQVTKGISSCNNTRAFGPDKLSIFHQKHLGPRAIECLTALFNDSVIYCRILSIWKSSIVIPIPKPGKDSSLCTTYRAISLLCPAAKVMEALLLPTVINHS